MDAVFLGVIALLGLAIVGMVVGCDRLAVHEMTWHDALYTLAGLAALGLFTYLVYALLRAEEF